MPAGPSRPPCDHSDSQYSETYDARYCPVCDLWLEGRCSDPECDYCPTRPERPSLIKIDEGMPPGS